MHPDKIATIYDLYHVDLLGCGFGWYNYGCYSILSKAGRRMKEPVIYLGDFLKMSPSEILGMKGVGRKTYNVFIHFLANHPNIMNISEFPYNQELKSKVMMVYIYDKMEYDIMKNVLISCAIDGINIEHYQKYSDNIELFKHELSSVKIFDKFRLKIVMDNILKKYPNIKFEYNTIGKLEIINEEYRDIEFHIEYMADHIKVIGGHDESVLYYDKDYISPDIITNIILEMMNTLYK